MTRKLFAPGCALMIYKPELAFRLLEIFNENLGEVRLLSTCCQHDPGLNENSEIINICPGCHKRYMNDYINSTTISVWEILAGTDFFRFPDYGGSEMTIIDACPTRDLANVHDAIRKILRKMNIKIVEPERTRTESTCCGDGFYGTLPTPAVKDLMIRKSSEMPLDEIVVYCVSCAKSVFIGKRKPRHIVDLLFGEDTVPKTFDPDDWHNELRRYIDEH